MARLNFHCHEEIEKQIKARGAVSDVLREVLSRYFYMLDFERQRLKGIFTPDELGLLADISNGTIFLPQTLNGLAYDVETEADDDYFTKWNVDRAELARKIDGLNMLQHAALVDRIELFWIAASTGMKVDHEGLLE